MQGKVEAVGPVKQGNYGPYSSFKVGGQWYTVDGDASRFANKDVSFRIQDKGKYKVAKDIVAADDAPPPAPAAATNGNGHAKPDQVAYKELLKWAHGVACELEPDEKVYERVAHVTEPGEFHEESVVKTDRSYTRAKIMNTIVMAYGKGDFVFDDDIPF